jgi:hypothetical protein
MIERVKEFAAELALMALIVISFWSLVAAFVAAWDGAIYDR